MFERFLAEFRVTARVQAENDEIASIPVLDDLVRTLGGVTVEEGLYRVHSASSANHADQLVDAAFNELQGMARCFGFDWLGRQFAADMRGLEQNDPPVLMLDAGAGEILQIPVSVARFHDYGLIEFREAALAPQFFAEWRSVTPTSVPLTYDQCVGYEVPLFLGGSDKVGNLALTDIDVYWTITGQLRARTRGLPVGTPVNVTRDDDVNH